MDIPAWPKYALRITFGVIWMIDAVLKWLPGFRSSYMSSIMGAGMGASLEDCMVERFSSPLPSVSAFFALNRLGYGARPGEVTEFARHGFRIWLDEQLKPPPGDGPETAQALENAQLRIKYAAGDPAKNQNWEAIDEMQPLGTLAQPIDALWPTVAERDKHDGAERRRPLLEVISATLIRAVHSQYPLREVMCNFWHDHFNVDAWGSEQVAVRSRRNSSKLPR